MKQIIAEYAPQITILSGMGIGIWLIMTDRTIMATVVFALAGVGGRYFLSL